MHWQGGFPAVTARGSAGLWSGKTVFVALWSDEGSMMGGEAGPAGRSSLVLEG